MQAVCFRKEDRMVGVEQRNALSRIVSLCITTDYVHTCHKEVEKEVMECFDSKIVWIERADRNVKSFGDF